MKKSSYVFALLGSCGLYYLGNRWTHIFINSTLEPLKAISMTCNTVFQEISKQPAMIYWDINSIGAGAMLVFVFWLFILYQATLPKNFRKGAEHGSAAWGTQADRQPYIDKDFKSNIILSDTEFLTLKSRLPKKQIKYARNKNIMVIGGSGSGKTRFFAKPNLMQLHSSFVVTDPKGTLLLETGKMFADNGYQVKFLNLIDMSQSMKYNPFNYIRSEEDVLKLVDNFMENTSDPNRKGGDKFWEDAEKLLYYAVFFYVYYEALSTEKNMVTVVELLKHADVRDDDPDYKSALDILFDDLRTEQPQHLALQFYDDFKRASAKTAQGILISESARLAKLKIPKILDLLSDDEIEFDTLGEEKTVLFVIIPDTNTTFNFIAAMLYTQMFDTLCYKADNEYGGRLPIHVRCILDEFANIGLIPNFEKLIATIRSREISAAIILQTLSQLKGLYKDHAETIFGNCDSFVYLGGTDKQAHKEVSEMLGKATVDVLNINKSKGRDQSSSYNYSLVGRELMTVDEIGIMDGGECIVRIRGSRPFKSRKFDIERHKNYKLLADYNKKNFFDISTALTQQNFNFDFAQCDIQEIDVA